MGVQERIVTELVCDCCKRKITGSSAKVGSLSARTQGARGRGEQWEMAFHPECYSKMIATATKPGGGARRGAKRGRPRGRPAAKAKATARGAKRRGRPRGRPPGRPKGSKNKRKK